MRLLVITNYIDQESGRGRYSLRVCEELRKKGYNPTLIVEKINYPGRFNQICLYGLSSLKSFVENCSLVRRTALAFNIVHAFDVWPYAIYGMVATIGSHRKLFISTHGTYSVPPKRISVKRFLMKLALVRAKRVFCNSDYTKTRIIERANNVRAEVLYMGTTQLQTDDSKAQTKFSASSAIDTNKWPRLLTVGAIERRKGQLFTVKSVEILREKFPKICYYIIGRIDSSAYYDEICEYINKHNLHEFVKILTQIDSNAELARLYEQSDIFLLNSINEGDHFEGFGLVILEANQYGKPAIGSKNTGMESAIQNGSNGYLANQSDPTDIAQKIKVVLETTPELWNKQCREFATRFTWEKTVEVMVTAYNEYA